MTRWAAPPVRAYCSAHRTRFDWHWHAVAAFSGLRSLIAIASGESTLSKPEQDRLTAEAPDLIPEWVEILSYWRLAHNPIAAPSATATFKNTGRNDPCPAALARNTKNATGLTDRGHHRTVTILNPAVAQLLVGEIESVFEDCQPCHRKMGAKFSYVAG